MLICENPGLLSFTPGMPTPLRAWSGRMFVQAISFHPARTELMRVGDQILLCTNTQLCDVDTSLPPPA